MADVGDGRTATVDVTAEGDALIVHLAGEFDALSVPRVRDAIDTALGSGNHSRVAFDLGDLTFMDSSGLAVLLAVAQRAPVELRRPSEIIRQVIEMTGLASVLPTV